MVTLHPPFLLVHLSEFIIPIEKIFLDQGKWKAVLETRDIVFQSIKKVLLVELQAYTCRKLIDAYAVWDVSERSGLLIIPMEKEHIQNECSWPKNVDRETLQEIIRLNSLRAEKQPNQTNFYWLNDQTRLIERVGILTNTEKLLISSGITKDLRLAKLSLEHRITDLFNLESILKGHVQNLFIEWDFERDISYMVFVLKRQYNNVP